MADLSRSMEVDGFGDKLIARLNGFRRSKLYYDVTIKVGDGEVCCHKIVLIACGGSFRSKFVDTATNSVKNDVTEMTINCSLRGLEPIIQFAYSGRLDIDGGSVLPCLLASQELEQKEIENVCKEMLKEDVSCLFTTKHLEQLAQFLKANVHNTPSQEGDKDPEPEGDDELLLKIRGKYPELENTYSWAVKLLRAMPEIEFPVEMPEAEVAPVAVVVAEADNPFGCEEEEEPEAANPFGCEEEDEPEVKGSSVSSNPFGCEEEEEELGSPVPEVVISKESNPFGCDEEESADAANPFGVEEESDVIKTPSALPSPKPRSRNVSATSTNKELAPTAIPRRATSPSMMRRKAPPPPPSPHHAESGKKVPPVKPANSPAAPGAGKRTPSNASQTSVNKTPPPRPKPPVIKKSANIVNASFRWLRKSVRRPRKPIATNGNEKRVAGADENKTKPLEQSSSSNSPIVSSQTAASCKKLHRPAPPPPIQQQQQQGGDSQSAKSEKFSAISNILPKMKSK